MSSVNRKILWYKIKLNECCSKDMKDCVYSKKKNIKKEKKINELTPSFTVAVAPIW